MQANKLIGRIKHNFIDRSKATVQTLYKGLVSPHLEYCIQVWNPRLAEDIKLIEGSREVPRNWPTVLQIGNMTVIRGLDFLKAIVDG